MAAKTRVAFLSFITVLMMMFSLSAPMVALADDGAPPPDPTTETETAPETGSTPPTEESVPTAEATGEAPSSEGSEQVPPAAEPEQDSASDEMSLPEVLDQAPDGTEVVVLDEQGEILPLATEEAAEVIATTDPMWCPDGVIPGGSGCSPAQDSMTDLIAWMTTNNPGLAGTIWIEDAYDSGTNLDDTGANFVLDGSVLTNMSNYALTVQGGWTGTSGDDTITGTSEFNGYLWITNWTGDVTLNDLVVADTSNIGLYVQTEGAVSVENVDAINNAYEGLQISADGDVEIHDSQFTNNGLVTQSSGPETEGSSGLNVDTNGDITLNQVFAYANGYHGAELYGDNIAVTESSFIDNGYTGYIYDAESDPPYESHTIYFNGGSGLYAEAGGDISLVQICACGNANFGAELYSSNGDVNVSESTFASNGFWGSGFSGLNLEQNGVDDYHYRFNLEYAAGSGLRIESNGDVTLAQVDAHENYGDGVGIFAGFFGQIGNIDISGSFFAINGLDNGYLGETEGYDWLEDSLAEFCSTADFTGFLIDLCIAGPALDAPYLSIWMTDLSATGGDSEVDETEKSQQLNQTGGFGLYIDNSTGDVTLDDVGAYANGADGAFISNEGNLTVSVSEFSYNGQIGNFSFGQGQSGLYDWVDGDTGQIFDQTSSGGFMAAAYGSGLVANSGNVTLTDIYAVQNFNDGVSIYADGNLVVQTDDEDYSVFVANGLGGGDNLLEDLLCSFSLCGVPVSEFFFSLYANEYHFEDDDSYASLFGVYGGLSAGSGLEASADGNATLSDVIAAANGGYGADLWTEGNTTVTNSGFYSNGEGIQAYLDLCFDDLDYCENQDGDPIDYLDFYLSAGSGLLVDAGGDILLDEVEAIDNALYGAELYSGAIDSVYVLDSIFVDNGYAGYGISFDSAEDLAPVIFGGDGLYIETVGNASICNSIFDNNADYGLDAAGVNGSLTLSDVVFGVNGSGDHNYAGDATITSGFNCLPPEPEDETGGPDDPGGPSLIIPVTGGEQITCEGLTGSSVTIMLPNGDHVVLPCPINDFAILNRTIEDGILEDLGDGFTFLSAMAASIVRDDNVVETIDGTMTVSFVIPEGTDVDDLVILWWDGSEWVELSEAADDGRLVFEAGRATGDGHFEAVVNFTGTFVLVKK